MLKKGKIKINQVKSFVDIYSFVKIINLQENRKKKFVF